MANERPVVVTVVAVLGFIFGALGILGGLFVMAGGASFGMMYGQQGAVAAGAMAGAGIGMIIMGIVELVIAWGLWIGKVWSWWLTVIFSALGILSIFSGSASGVISAAISAVILWYFFKPEVKDYFGVKVEFPT